MRRLQGGTNRNFMCFYQITRKSDHSRNEENENCETLKRFNICRQFFYMLMSTTNETKDWGENSELWKCCLIKYATHQLILKGHLVPFPDHSPPPPTLTSWWRILHASGDSFRLRKSKLDCNNGTLSALQSVWDKVRQLSNLCSVQSLW